MNYIYIYCCELISLLVPVLAILMMYICDLQANHLSSMANIYGVSGGSGDATTVQYVHYTHKVTFNEARAVCLTIGGDLAKVESSTKRSWIRSLGSSSIFSDHLWVGLAEKSKNKPFWVSDCSTDIDTSKIEGSWASDQMCIILKSGTYKFDMKKCDNEEMFLCELYTNIVQSETNVDPSYTSSLIPDDHCTPPATTTTRTTTTSTSTITAPTTTTTTPTTSATTTVKTTTSTTPTIITTSRTTPTTSAATTTATTTTTPTSSTQTPTTSPTTTSPATTTTNVFQEMITTITMPIKTPKPTTTVTPTATTAVTTAKTPTTTATTPSTTITIPTTKTTTTPTTYTTTTSALSSITVISATESSSTLRTSTLSSPTCYCEKTPELCNINIGVEQAIQIAAELSKNLTISIKTTSSYRRKLTSAEDERLSSQFLGYSGMALVVAPLTVLLVMDIVTLFQSLTA